MSNEKNYPIFRVMKMGGQGLKKNAFLILIGIAKFADNETGECYPSVTGLSEWSGKSETAVHDALRELESKGRISIERGGGREHNHYTITFDVTGTESVPLQYGTHTPEVRNPDSCGTESGGELLYLSSGRNVFKELTEAKAIASASADASQSDHTPRSGETRKDKSHTGDPEPLGSSPAVEVDGIESIPIDPLIIDTPWEYENELALLAWRTSYARPYVLDDFLLIEARYGKRIEAICDGHGTLPLLIKWACHIGKDFPDLKDTTELREEFPHILLKVTAYILKAELTPRMFQQRVEKAYLDNFTLGPVGETRSYGHS